MKTCSAFRRFNSSACALSFASEALKRSATSVSTSSEEWDALTFLDKNSAERCLTSLFVNVIEPGGGTGAGVFVYMVAGGMFVVGRVVGEAFYSGASGEVLELHRRGRVASAA